MNNRIPPLEKEPHLLLAPFYELLAAAQFLTIAPAFVRRPFSAKEMGRSVGFYPLIGLIVGAVLLGANTLLTFLLPLQVRAALILTLWIILSGGLHFDGFLDSFDGLFGGHTTESRLRIMHDERVGAFGLAAGICLLLIKFTALSALTNWNTALLLAPTLGRWGMSIALVAFPYGRKQGLGRDIKDNTGWREAIISSLIAVVIAWLSAGWAGLAAFGLAGIVIWICAKFTLKRIPGLTGDIYGALNEIVEVCCLLLLIPLLHMKI